ncbi:MAG: OmpA family protein [Trichloromonadaceae bacterium]
MKFGKWFCVMMALVMAGTMAAPAQAANRAGALTLSPMVGGYLFEGDQPVDQDALTYGLGLGYNFTNNFGLELLGQFTEGEVENSNDDYDVLNLSLNAVYNIGNLRSFVPYVTAGVGVMNISQDNFRENDNLAGNYGLGAKFFLSENVALRLDARHYIGFDDKDFDLNETDNNLSYMAGLTFQTPAPAAPAPKDSDGDGVPDSLDKCPDTPKGVQVDANGCPLDSDGDGVPDYLDKCPGTPAGTKVDANGCPIVTDSDSDGDGVPDSRDKCPGTPAGVKVDADGCPLDSDGDGVPDHLDKCPDTPKGAKVDASGCPLDSDGDGVADYLDKCPNTPKGVMVDETGCPVSLTLQIKFDFDKSDIKPAFQGELKKAADFIAKYPGNKILVAGHTDSMGTDDYNQKLSERRANAVREYLIAKHGVPADKMVARGYGESQPVADNGTAEGQTKNRRVEVICCTVIPD